MTEENISVQQSDTGVPAEGGGNPAGVSADPSAKASAPAESAEELKRKIAELKAALEKKDGEIRAVKIGAAADAALIRAGAKNLTAVKALIAGLDEMELSEDGKIAGLDEKISAVKASDGYLFEQKGGKLSIRGVKPEESSGGHDGEADISGMTYSQLEEYIGKNPNVKIFD